MAVETTNTQNFSIVFDDTEYPGAQLVQVKAVVQDMATGCEKDLATMCQWFDVDPTKAFGPGNPTVVTVTKKLNGGSNTGYSKHKSQMQVEFLPGEASDEVLLVFVDEMSEILMSYVGGWHAGYSDGEGLSRVCGALLHPASAEVNVNAWTFFDPTQDPSAAVADDAFRKDWISTNFQGGALKAGGNVAGDQDAYSVGCSMLFQFFLRSQLDFSINELCQSMPKAGKKGHANLAGAYAVLTNETVAAYSQFIRFVALWFGSAATNKNTLTTNNPFPLAITNVTPAAAGEQKGIYLFVAMTNGQIIYDMAAPGGAGIGWQDVPGQEVATTSVASAILGDEVYLFNRRGSSDIAFNKAGFKKAFGNWSVVPGGMKTNLAVSAAGRPTELFLFATTTDGSIQVNQIAPNGAFVGWAPMIGAPHTNTAVAAAMQDQTLFVFANQAGGGAMFTQAPAGGAFAAWQALPGAPATNLPMAAAGRKGNLFVFLVGVDGQIHFNQIAPGGPWVGWQVIPGGVTTTLSVAAGMSNTTLFVYVRTADGRMICNQAAEGGAFVGWELVR